VAADTVAAVQGLRSDIETDQNAAKRVKVHPARLESVGRLSVTRAALSTPPTTTAIVIGLNH
jgi:hypothetical protein